MMEFPLPPAEALVFSDALKKRVTDRIESQNGWISFADYMACVLYEPGLGYYSGGSANLGESGDFVTAPEMSPLYGHTLADAVIPLMRQTEPKILELGAGTGRLAHDVLDRFSSSGVTCDSYEILEVSPELRQRQQAMLGKYRQIGWLDSLPECFEGVLIANEVLDAMPVQLVVRRKTGWYELGVGYREGRFVFDERPASSALADSIAFQIPDSGLLPEGYVTEIHTQACAFIRSLANRLAIGKAGAAIFVDYGFPGHEYYHPERTAGTLMCHYRHRAHTDPFFLPGLQDITAHLDFTSLARAAAEEGLDVLCYTTQANFLIGSGLIGLVQDFSEKRDDAQFLLQSQAVQKLLSPAEMGEVFKVLILGHNITPPAFMLEIDKSGRL